jgi:glutaminase
MKSTRNPPARSSAGARSLLLAFFVAFATFAAPGAGAQPLPARDSIVATIREAYLAFRELKTGANADYIPELAKVPSDLFGIAIVTAGGEVFTEGDSDWRFSIQSVSKPFTAALVMQQYGSANILRDKIGVEPTGQRFNSILATQILPGVSGNPLVNPGAIAAVSLVKARNPEERFVAIRECYEGFAAARLEVLEDVYRSEADSNERNKAHAYILAASGRLYADPLESVDVYTRQCAIGVTVLDLAMMGATLANRGVNPKTGERVLEAAFVPGLLAIMTMAGFYDESGTWAFEAGLPAKTGVGGGIVAVVPGKLAIAAFSPRLNASGNSVRAMAAISLIADRLGLGIFGR